MDDKIGLNYGDSIFYNKSAGTLQRSITCHKIPKAARFKKKYFI